MSHDWSCDYDHVTLCMCCHMINWIKIYVSVTQCTMDSYLNYTQRTDTETELWVRGVQFAEVNDFSFPDTDLQEINLQPEDWNWCWPYHKIKVMCTLSSFRVTHSQHQLMSMPSSKTCENLCDPARHFTPPSHSRLVRLYLGSIFLCSSNLAHHHSWMNPSNKEDHKGKDKPTGVNRVGRYLRWLVSP